MCCWRSEWPAVLCVRVGRIGGGSWRAASFYGVSAVGGWGGNSRAGSAGGGFRRRFGRPNQRRRALWVGCVGCGCGGAGEQDAGNANGKRQRRLSLLHWRCHTGAASLAPPPGNLHTPTAPLSVEHNTSVASMHADTTLLGRRAARPARVPSARARTHHLRRHTRRRPQTARRGVTGLANLLCLSGTHMQCPHSPPTSGTSGLPPGVTRTCLPPVLRFTLQLQPCSQQGSPSRSSINLCV